MCQLSHHAGCQASTPSNMLTSPVASVLITTLRLWSQTGFHAGSVCVDTAAQWPMWCAQRTPLGKGGGWYAHLHNGAALFLSEGGQQRKCHKEGPYNVGVQHLPVHLASPAAAREGRGLIEARGKWLQGASKDCQTGWCSTGGNSTAGSRRLQHRAVILAHSHA